MSYKNCRTNFVTKNLSHTLSYTIRRSSKLILLVFCSVKLSARMASMVCNAKKAATAEMVGLATPLMVPVPVLMVGKAQIVGRGVVKIPRHMGHIVHSSVLVTGTTPSCKYFSSGDFLSPWYYSIVVVGGLCTTLATSSMHYTVEKTINVSYSDRLTQKYC